MGRSHLRSHFVITQYDLYLYMYQRVMVYVLCIFFSYTRVHYIDECIRSLTCIRVHVSIPNAVLM